MAEFTFYSVAMSRGQISRWALHEAGADHEHVLMEGLGHSDETIRTRLFIAMQSMAKIDHAAITAAIAGDRT